MSLEEVVGMTFMKVDRSYTTPPGWRLATFVEARNNLEMIKEEGLLTEWERARLLDGWISGPCYNFQIGDNFKGCMGYMLLIQMPAISELPEDLYGSVSLTEKGKEVALLLCAEDWNYEVAYWVLNSWAEGESMEPGDVRQGSIPFGNATKFQEMNMFTTEMARKFAETPATACGRVANKKLSSRSVVHDVFLNMATSCCNNLRIKDQKILGPSSYAMKWIVGLVNHISETCSNEDWLRNFASQRDVTDVIWNFMWDFLTSVIIVKYECFSLGLVIKEWADAMSQPQLLTTREKNFIVTTFILYYLNFYQLRETKMYELEMILKYASKHVTGDRDHFKEVLQDAPYRCNWFHQQNGDYGVLNKILILAAQEPDTLVLNKVLDCGAQPLATLSRDEKKTALHYAAMLDDNDKMIDIGKSLFNKCDENEGLANAADEEGKTALHWASMKGKAHFCELLLSYEGTIDARDNDLQVPLHYAVKGGKHEVIDVLIGRGKDDTMQSEDVNEFNQKRSQMVNCKDKDGQSPLDVAACQNNINLVAKLLSISEQPPEACFQKVNSAKLLCQFALEGNKDIVGKLLESGANPLHEDEEGQTALHYAAMCDDEYEANSIAKLIVHKSQEKQSLVAKCDRRGRTVLHLAAFKGHQVLCEYLLSISPGLVNVKDADGRNPLYEAVKGKDDFPYIINILLKDIMPLDGLIDRKGLTLLHVAASEGKILMVDRLLSFSERPKVYVKKPDFLGQTALHRAAKGGHTNTVKVLLHWGAQPLLERDCDGRTALHYAVQTKTGLEGIALVKLLFKKCGSNEKKLLFLWASAAGLGTADQIVSDPLLKRFLLEQREDISKAVATNNLLRTAASLGDIEMTIELLTRGSQIVDIQDQQWRSDLKKRERYNVEKVLKQIQMIAEQGNDQPTVSDNLGRADFAHGLAALLLNPYLKSPITVGITGNWGMGKSSLMIQTEIILLKTAAQLALLPSSKLSNSNFPGIQIFELTKNGKKKYQKIKRWVDLLKNGSRSNRNFFVTMRNFFVTMRENIHRWTMWRKNEESYSEHGDSVVEFVNNYETKYHNFFKSLAAMGSSEMFTTKGQPSQSRTESSNEGSVPAILTVRYNAWKYRNESEALAGMAVEITKQMEEIMTEAQWLSTCLRNSWRQQKKNIWVEVIFPCLLAVLLACSITWIGWLLLDRYKFRESKELKYASLPATIVFMVWALVKSVVSTVNPVSSQLMNYVKFPDHSEKLGYQERVISDITFLKGEIGRRPHFVCTAATSIWRLITRRCNMSCPCPKCFGEMTASSKFASASNAEANLRIIVFVDDLDRCHESVILQVLSSINLVLAVCEISVILGMDRALIERAIVRKYGYKYLKSSQQLPDMYLQKIIQLPLDLPEPSEVQSKRFLEGQLGVFKENNNEDLESDTDEQDDSKIETDEDYYDLFSPFQRHFARSFPHKGEMGLLVKKIMSGKTSVPDVSGSRETGKALPETNAAEEIAIDVEATIETNASSLGETNPPVKIEGEAWLDTHANRGVTGGHSSNQLIPIREMLFIRYSDGERQAFTFFQNLTTDFRKLPREWKRLLTYHRLVWNIFFISKQAKHLDGWQVQLITWIFICWEWEDNINLLIRNWNRNGVLKTSEWKPTGPSLQVIVEHSIRNESWIIEDNRGENTTATDHEGDAAKILQLFENKESGPQKMKECVKEDIVSENTENTQSGIREPEILKEDAEMTVSYPYVDIVKTRDDCETSNRAGTDKLDDVVKEQDDILQKKSRMKLDELERQIEDLLKENKDLKEQVGSKQQARNRRKKSADEKKMELQNWWRLRSALDKHDVSMDGIQVFQRFRFYCVAGHLPWPLTEEDNGHSLTLQ